MDSRNANSPSGSTWSSGAGLAVFAAAAALGAGCGGHGGPGPVEPAPSAPVASIGADPRGSAGNAPRSAVPAGAAGAPAPVGAAGYYCFEVTFPDGARNSECVREMHRCASDLESMRGYAQPGSVFQGCYPVATVYCYVASNELCFTQPMDCERSREIIAGGPCGPRR